MSFYVQLPDEYGNVGFGWVVIEATVEPGTEVDAFGATLHITAPAGFAWPSLRQGYGWVECDGPARTLSEEEHQEITAGLAAAETVKQ